MSALLSKRKTNEKCKEIKKKKGEASKRKRYLASRVRGEVKILQRIEQGRGVFPLPLSARVCVCACGEGRPYHGVSATA